ncbi:MAG: HAD-IC family P-type ATPase [Saprospiraceae bacterium]|nr:HAD-IC family P-type ATPase [Saprospiraceae bacterium]
MSAFSHQPVDLPFHAKSAAKTMDHWTSTEVGLTNEAVLERREKYGWNTLTETKLTPWYIFFIRQFRSLLILILVIAAGIAWSAGKEVDAWVIIGIVFINAFIGFYQELKAEGAVTALKKMVIHKARVRRDGHVVSLPTRELVPGDIILLEEGDNIPADARILHAKNIRTIEASLTGESVPSGKSDVILPPETPLADRKNMLWKGTFVVGGFAQAIVCATGSATALGQIATSLAEIKNERTNFQKKTDVLGRQMGFIAIGSALLLFITGYFIRDMEIREIMLVSIAALVSSIPEGLPAVLSIVLAIGSHRMAKRNAIIREFTSVETLGAVTTIITDKTGTLTQNSLTVKKVWSIGKSVIDVTGEGWLPVGNFYRDKEVFEPTEDPVLSKLLTIAGISNNSTITHHQEKDTYILTGDPTEGALLVLARKGGFTPTAENIRHKKDDLPFNSKLKFRATLYAHDEALKELFIIGAPEKILALADEIHTADGTRKMTHEDCVAIEQKINHWSGQSMRVIGIAYRTVSQATTVIEEEAPHDLVFLGLTGMMDPPRPDVRASVLRCRKAGIRVIMATGDHVHTALSIAKSTAIVDSDGAEEPLAMTESQLALLDEREFEEAVAKVNVFARLTPKMKLRIAETLQARGELVAMTGDGVNDAPALKQADVGISMGIMGTDVAREASQVVLADDNFATIVNAVEEGRIVFTNARQTSYFLLTTNFSEIIILVTLVGMGYPIALTATQILWLNLVTDGIGDKSLATEKGHGDVLEEKRVSQKEQILNLKAMPFLLLQTLVMSALGLMVFFYYLPIDLDKARTATFSVMAFSQIFNILNLRSLRKSIFAIGVFSNKYVNIALILAVIIQLVIIEIPFFQQLFHFKTLSALEFSVLIGLSSIILWVGEMYKFVAKQMK